MQYDVNRETAKISALSSGEIDKYEYLMVNKFSLPIKVQSYNKLLTLAWKKYLKNK